MARFRNRSLQTSERLAKSLGWLGIGMGICHLLTHRNRRKRGGIKWALAGACAVASVYCVEGCSRRHAYQAGPTPDYSGRSGFPQGLEQARGVAAQRSGRKLALPSPECSPGPRL